MKEKIKIYVSYHKPSVLLKNNILTPIHVGRNIATRESKDGNISNTQLNWLKQNMIGDDTGENISHLNRRFSEVTAHYYVWKNQETLGNPDYIGFMHYRRHLNFNNAKSNKELCGEYLNQEYINKIGLNEKQIEKIVLKNDIVCVKPWDVRESNCKNIYEQYNNYADLDIEDYDIALRILKEKFPKFSKAADDYNASCKGWFTNIFIMKKDIFNNYSNWLFEILLECEKQIQNYDDINKNRVIGHIAERLFGIYLTYLRQNNKKIKIKELQRSMVQNTDLTLEIQPKYEGEIPIILSSDNNYIPYLATTIQSIAKNASLEEKYSIYILHTDISKHSQTLIKSIANCNMNIKFVDVSTFFNEQDISIFHINNHFSVATYFRFYIPQIFKYFEKVIYCDCDAVFVDDIAKLYKINIQDKWLGATKDIGVFIETQKHSKEKTNYYKNILKLTYPENYFQAGLLIFNIKELIKNDFTNKCIKKLIDIKTPKYVDQCILNAVCENYVQYIDPKWNVQAYIPTSYPDFINFIHEDKNIYLETYKNPLYVHYSGVQKPWEIPDMFMGEYFWTYARQCPFYEKILYENASKFIVYKNKYLNDRFKLTFLQKLFSIKNLTKKNKKYKIITILGIRIKKGVGNAFD